MSLWDGYVHLLTGVLSSLEAATHGSLGGAILLLSLAVRLALLPLALRQAARARTRQRALAALEPELKLLREQQPDPLARAAAEAELLRQRGVSGPGGLELLGLVVQGALGTGVYSAVRAGLGVGRRFLWIADLARPDAWVVGLAVALTAASAALAPAVAGPAKPALLPALVPALMTAAMLWHLASGLGLYWAAGSAVALVQALVPRLSARPGRPGAAR